MRGSISKWDNIYQNGILVYDWPKVASQFNNFKLDIEIPEDIKMALFSIHPNHLNEILHYKGLTEWLGDSSIYELLTGTSKYDYTLEEGVDLVKWYIISYWSAKYK